MVFFQATLLLSYSYTHLSTRFQVRKHSYAHILLLALPLLVLPIGLPSWNPPSSGQPIGWLFLVLLVSVGAPYFAIATANPTLQRWFSTSGHRLSGDPYFLASSSNAGSLVGLLAYPILVEPNLTLSEQARWWAVGYVCFLLLSVVAASFAGSSADSSAAESISDTVADDRGAANPAVASDRVATDGVANDAPITWGTRFWWLFLAFVPTSTMMGATTVLTTDVASIPMLWVLPLSAYLITFILAFGRVRRLSASGLFRMSALLFASTGVAFAIGTSGAIAGVGSHLFAVFAIGLVCHGRLSHGRPSATRLTEFFMIISIGGVLAGLFNTLVAPLLFTTTVEYPLVVAASVIAVFPARAKRRPMRPVGMIAVVGLIIAVLVGASGAVRPAGYQHRSFYGTLRIQDSKSARVLIHGTTVHGVQLKDPNARLLPTSYYAKSGPLGQVFEAYEDSSIRRNIGMVGLGVGVAAAYTRPGDAMRYYELDPEDVRVASDPSKFTFLSEAKGKVDVVVGDARTNLKKEPSAKFGMLVIDAFSSDSIPTHLMTREAVQLYMDKLQEGGLLAIHISNRHLDLEPVLGAIARDAGLSARMWSDFKVTKQQRLEQKRESQWMVLARADEDLAPLAGHGAWKNARVREGRSWTDDFSDVFSVFRK